ncbi:MAG: LysR family transcriptional regulator [Rhodospirillaceae bacterium]|nr:LysR family transcriptional regulator [Rhodospirillaceae bacterium]MBT6086717.1 LysR family transcriptional regulator [Rhodospirillaceae bacterium]MBT6882997.1 LysR family transcriptional regulator [Rhodospirillaceae bacterium]
MKYTQVRSFHAVAKAGSFTGGARDLNVSQPTVTEQVRELEATYGIEVFNRAQRKAKLTAVGRSLFEITQRLFGLVGETEAFLRAAGDYGAGHLRVSSVLPFFIVDIVTVFREHYPLIKISVSSGNSATSLQRLLTYESDVGVLSDHDPDHRLYTRVHDSHFIVAIVSSDHPWATRESISITELHDQPMVMREVGSNTRSAFESAANAAGVSPNIVMDIESGEAVREAVARGHGIGVYGELALPSDPRLKALQFTDAEMKVNRYLACLHERKNEFLVEAFFDVATRAR